MTHSLQQQLSSAWSAIDVGTSQAVRWIDTVRNHAPSLESEADALKLDLYRHKNLANSLAEVANTPMTVGFFGLSQAGKSYLISALAADKNGNLITDLGGEQLDFLLHVNPAGGGSEATGLVTRFSRLAKASPDPNFPIELRLFKEIEIAIVLSNAWFNDFNQELIKYDIDETLIAAHLKEFAHQTPQTEPINQIAPEDIVMLMDYLGDARSVSKLKAQYWAEAIRLVPYLSLVDRAKFFSILWGQQNRITQVYIQLTEALEGVGFAQKIYAPLSALVQKSGDDYVPENNIMNVKTLGLLGDTKNTPLMVRPVINDELQAPASIRTAELTALVSEMTFRLIAEPQDPVVEKVDLLDFPGYRSRLNMPNTSALTEQKDIIAQLLLRGKVSYLFERYTNRQEMNGLIMCARASGQGDVPNVDQVLSDWVRKTQGETDKERSNRLPGLIWAMTIMDVFIATNCEKSSSQRSESCGSLTHMTMLEHFGHTDWMVNWNGKPFNNTYLVRKPRYQTTFIERDEDKNEIRFEPSAQEAINELRNLFISDPSILKHINQPEDAWDSMMTLNNGGITRLGQGVDQISDPSFKLQRIQEQLEEVQLRIKNSLGRWYHQDADDAEAVQKAKAQNIIRALQQSVPALPEMMSLLSLDSAVIRNLYHSTSTATPNSESTEQETPALTDDFMADFSIDLDLGLDLAIEAVTETSQTNSLDNQFSHRVYSAWIQHLRAQSLKNSKLSTLNITNYASIMPDLIQELITASNRLGLLDELNTKVNTRLQSNSRHEQVAMRYVSYAQSGLNEFISYLGYLKTPVEDRLQYQNPQTKVATPLFQFHEPLKSGLPVLEPVQQLPLMRFLTHWLFGLYHLIIENAGHSAGREISIEHNAELGKVLQSMRVL